MWKIKLSLSFGQANFCSGSVVLVNVADRDDLSLKKKIYLLQNCDLLSKSQKRSFVIYLVPLGSSLLICIIYYLSNH